MFSNFDAEVLARSNEAPSMYDYIELMFMARKVSLRAIWLLKGCCIFRL